MDEVPRPLAQLHLHLAAHRNLDAAAHQLRGVRQILAAHRGRRGPRNHPSVSALDAWGVGLQQIGRER